jgi:hypothetical protein
MLSLGLAKYAKAGTALQTSGCRVTTAGCAALHMCHICHICTSAHSSPTFSSLSLLPTVCLGVCVGGFESLYVVLTSTILLILYNLHY